MREASGWVGLGWWLVVKCFLKKAGRGTQERAREGERGECVTALGKFKVTAPSTAAGFRSGDRRRNFAASRPCVCARGSVSECARVAGRARERAGWGRGGWGRRERLLLLPPLPRAQGDRNELLKNPKR